jgi:four helix bundle protein
MENQKRSNNYSNSWKRSPYPQKTGGYQKKEPLPAQHLSTEARVQTTVAAAPGAKTPEAAPSEKINDFRDLHIWKLGKELVLDTYRATKALPPDELYGLTTQMRRAAISIPSNISEGYNRRYTKDYQRFLSFALGSCAELETQIEVCKDLGHFSPETCGSLLEKMDHETRMIRSLMNKL